jgi:hypothetical protein
VGLAQFGFLFNDRKKPNKKSAHTQAHRETNITERKFKQEEEIALHYPKP